MRVVSREEFLSLPPGTVYASGHFWSMSDWRIKGETKDETCECTLMGIDGNDAFLQAIKNGTEFPFEPRNDVEFIEPEFIGAVASVVCVMDKADIQKLIAQFQACLGE